MPLGTLDSSPPAFFRQGPSAFSKLVFFSALAVLLMVSDSRFALVQPLRAGLATLLYPLQWALMRPLEWAKSNGAYLESLNTSQAREAMAKYRLGLQSQRAQQVEQLLLENSRLRALLELRERIKSPALAAQVLYDAADPYSRKLIIDKGLLQAVQAGAPVLDEFGVLGQVTRAYPMSSEVTLISDRNQAIPVLNARSGVRALAFGNTSTSSDALTLRYMNANVDMQVGDLLTTSGIDGVYPPGLSVARVSTVGGGVDTAFASISATPIAQVSGSLHVLVLQPVSSLQSPPPASKPADTSTGTSDAKGVQKKLLKKDQQP